MEDKKTAIRRVENVESRKERKMNDNERYLFFFFLSSSFSRSAGEGVRTAHLSFRFPRNPTMESRVIALIGVIN